MSQTAVRKTSIAGLTIELPTDVVPTELHLLPAGPTFKAVDGRPFECGTWQINAVIAAAVVARASAQQTDIVVDFEHQTLRARENGQRAEAAGWIPRTLEWREGEGLYAVNVSWVGDTVDLIKQKKYRYISAVFLYDASTGQVLEIISVALTNTPALDGLDALADLARAHSVFSTEGEDSMNPQEVAALTTERNGLQTQVATLTTENGTLKTANAALTTERDDARTKLAALESDVAKSKETADKEKHTALLTAALNDGRLTPALKPWAEKQSLAALTEYLDTTKPLPIVDPQHDKDNKDKGAHGLSADELAWCSRMDVPAEEYAATKKTLAKA